MNKFVRYSLFTAISLLTFIYLIFVVYHKNKEKEVIQWLKRVPQSQEHAERKNVIAYESIEEWEGAGRKIKGVENILINFIDNGIKDDSINPPDVVFALTYVGSSKSISVLKRILVDKHQWPSSRRIAATELGLMRIYDAVEPLCKIVSSRDEEPLLRYNSVAALSEIGDPNSILIIEEYIEDSSVRESYRNLASKWLVKLKEKIEKTEKTKYCERR